MEGADGYAGRGKRWHEITRWYILWNQVYNHEASSAMSCRDDGPHRRRALEGRRSRATLQGRSTIFPTKARDSGDYAANAVTAAPRAANGRNRGPHSSSGHAASRGLRDHSARRILAAAPRCDVPLGQVAFSSHGSKKDSRLRPVATADLARKLSAFANARPTNGQ